MKFEHVFVVGAGGIGSNLLEPLARLLAYHKDGVRDLTVIDGDIYEEKNQERQLFDAKYVGTNKAEAAASRLTEAVFPVEHVSEYLNKEKFTQLLESRTAVDDMILVLAAVDNHASRKMMIEVLDETNRPNFVFISGGNGLYHGQAMVYAKVQGESPTLHPFEKYDDLKFPDDHIPGTPGCQDEAPSTPQFLVANFGAALCMLWLVQAFLDNEKWFVEVHFHSQSMKVEPHGDGIKLNVNSSDEGDSCE